MRAESKCLTPLNSSPLLFVAETPSSSDRAFETVTSAFLTANSTVDATTISHRTNHTLNAEDDEDDDDNRNHSRYSNYTYFQTPILKFNKSDAFRNLRRRRLNNTVLRNLNALSKLSVSHRERISIEALSQPTCMCAANITDGNCLISFIEMSVTPAEYRSATPMVTSTPIMAAPIIGKDVINYDHSIFSIARVKKVELHDLSPKVPEFNNGKWLKEQCSGINYR